MENCLVTKYKAVVDNDSLLKLGEVVYTVKTTPPAGQVTYARFYVDCSENCSIIVKAKNATIKPGTWGTAAVEMIDSNTIEVSYSGKLFIGINESVDTVKLSVIPKYNIEGIYNYVHTGTEFQYMTNLKYFEFSPTQNDDVFIDDLFTDSPSALVDLQFGGDRTSRITCSVDFLRKLPNLQNLICNSTLAYITGEMKNLGKNTELTKFSSVGANFSTLNLEDFVAKARGAGRTIESTGVDLAWGNYNIKFDGDTIRASSGHWVLTWTASDITVVDTAHTYNKTINNSTVDPT